MFWKKQKIEKDDFVVELPDVPTLVDFVKGTGGDNIIKWLDELKTERLIRLVDKTDLTNEELQFRKGEINSLKMVISLLKEIRFVKPEPEETEETNA